MDSTGKTPALLKLKEAAGFLSLSSWQLRRMVRRGELPAVRINSRLLFEVAELQRLIAVGRARAEVMRASKANASHSNG